MTVKFNPNDVMMNNKEGFVPEEFGQPILEDMIEGSLMMQLAKYEPMTTSKKKFDVYLGGLGAYWVGEGEQIRTSSPKWTQISMEAKKLGVIIPVSREYLYYKQKDFWTFIRPRIAEAFYKKFDEATILGTESPFAWSIDKSATAKKVSGELTTANVTKMYDNLYGDGFAPNAVISKLANRSTLNSLTRQVNGVATSLYTNGQLDGVPVFDLNRNIQGIEKGTLYTGDFNYAYYGIPYNLNYLISQEATLTTLKDENGNPVNLFDRELAALRATMDVAFMIVKDDAFASLKPAAGGTGGGGAKK